MTGVAGIGGEAVAVTQSFRCSLPSPDFSLAFVCLMNGLPKLTAHVVNAIQRDQNGEIDI